MRTSLLDSGSMLPLVVEATEQKTDLCGWARDNRAFIDRKLLEHGGLLFRGFAVDDQAAFERFAAAISTELIHYVEGATPRVRLSDKVYTSTEFPPSHPIRLHNELTYVTTWPTRIWFCCLEPSESGGETPVADVRRVYDRLAPSITDEFRRRGGWMLVRNFGSGLSLPWQTAFRTSDVDSLEQYCRTADVTWEWLDGDRLRTRQVRPAVARHPVTREWLWFNHIAFWHLAALPEDVRDSMLSLFDIRDVPYHVYYGDGSPIDPATIDQICNAYDAETVTFPWLRGDVLMLDNMLVAHGRRPYSGSRRIIVAMGDPCRDRGLDGEQFETPGRAAPSARAGAHDGRPPE